MNRACLYCRGAAPLRMLRIRRLLQFFALLTFKVLVVFRSQLAGIVLVNFRSQLAVQILCHPRPPPQAPQPRLAKPFAPKGGVDLQSKALLQVKGGLLQRFFDS